MINKEMLCFALLSFRGKNAFVAKKSSLISKK